MNKLQWLTLSELLTGFEQIDLRGTGLLDNYHELLCESVPESMKDLAELSDEASQSDSSAVVLKVAMKGALGPLLKDIIMLWYLGSWNRKIVDVSADGTVTKRESGVVSPEAYKQGLAWRTIGVKPMGVRPPGFGSWSLEPAKFRDITL